MKIQMIILVFYYGIFHIANQALFSQSNSEDKQIQLQQQIRTLKTKIAEQKKREAFTLDLLENIQQEASLTKDLINNLKKEEKTKRNEIDATEIQLNQSETELAKLKSLYSKRLVYIYKHGVVRDLEIILKTKSFNQAFRWLKYQQILTENDRRNIVNIKKKQQQISQNKKKLNKFWQDTQALIKDKDQHRQSLQHRQKEKKSLLTKIRRNKPLYLRKIREAENSLAQIENLILAQESKRHQNADQLNIIEYSSFPELKRKMFWPVKGKVIKKFGNYRHPTLKTITKSLGVDIKADYNEPVLAVADGVIARIQWMRGVGTLILINHYSGYYTVYANIAEVLVEKDATVQIGQTIGRVSDAGFDNLPKLHFEIWENNQAVDPLKWLQ